MVYVIRSPRLAAFLMEQGIRLERTDADRNNPRMNVFLFEDSEKLQTKITEYNKKLK